MQSSPQEVSAVLSQAQQDLAHSRWRAAQDGFARALQWVPRMPQLHHNMALCHLALGQAEQAISSATQALALSPQLWQSQMVQGNALKLLNRPEQADAAFEQVIQRHQGNAQALLARADLAINVFGMPLQAIEWIEPLLRDPKHAVDAQLTTLMASLYDRDISAQALTQKVMSFASQHLCLPSVNLPPLKSAGSRRSGANGKARPRVALLSPLFCASPVYFLTIAGWRHVAKGSDIVIFNRGHKSDWATEEFKTLAHEWHDVQAMPAEDLALFMHKADIDYLYDLGGWMDPIGLKALSVKPAREMFKWVGGQSLTTGLQSFDGWIGDEWQSPKSLQHLYTEKLINIERGYATYTPPPYLPNAPEHKLSTPVIFSNPSKLSRRFLAWLADVPGPKVFVHHQFRFARTREKVLRALGPNQVQFICPGNHREALDVIGRHEWMIDTFPYSSGLTAREAHAMGMKVKVFTGELFCERHSLHLA